MVAETQGTTVFSVEQVKKKSNQTFPHRKSLMYIDTIKKRKKGNTNAAKKKRGKKCYCYTEEILVHSLNGEKKECKKKAPHPCDSAKLIE